MVDFILEGKNIQWEISPPTYDKKSEKVSGEGNTFILIFYRMAYWFLHLDKKILKYFQDRCENSKKPFYRV